MIVGDRRSWQYGKSKFRIASETRAFAIYRDQWKASDIKIHRNDCRTYTNRVPAATVTWHHASNYQDAEAMAKEFSEKDGIGYRECILCNPSQPMVEI